MKQIHIMYRSYIYVYIILSVNIHTYIHALHCLALPYIKLHYITLHYIHITAQLHHITSHSCNREYSTCICTHTHIALSRLKNSSWVSFGWPCFLPWVCIGCSWMKQTDLRVHKLKTATIKEEEIRSISPWNGSKNRNGYNWNTFFFLEPFSSVTYQTTI